MRAARYLIALIILIAAGWLYWQSYNPVAPINEANPATDTSDNQPLPNVRISFEFDEDTTSFNNYTWLEDVTVFQATKNVLETREQVFEAVDYGDLGVLVTNINGYENGSNNAYWQYWVNGEQPLIAANLYQLQPGDILEWKFTQSVY